MNFAPAKKTNNKIKLNATDQQTDLFQRSVIQSLISLFFQKVEGQLSKALGDTHSNANKTESKQNSMTNDRVGKVNNKTLHFSLEASWKEKGKNLNFSFFFLLPCIYLFFKEETNNPKENKREIERERGEKNKENCSAKNKQKGFRLPDVNLYADW